MFVKGSQDSTRTEYITRTIQSATMPCANYCDVIMVAMASEIASLTIVYSTIYTWADQRKHQSSVSMAFEWGIHRWPVSSPHKWPVTRKMFPFDDVIMVFMRHIGWPARRWSTAIKQWGDLDIGLRYTIQCLLTTRVTNLNCTEVCQRIS